MNARPTRFETLAGALAVLAWLVAVIIVEGSGDKGDETPAELLAYFEDNEGPHLLRQHALLRRLGAHHLVRRRPAHRDRRDRAREPGVDRSGLGGRPRTHEHGPARAADRRCVRRERHRRAHARRPHRRCGSPATASSSRPEQPQPPSPRVSGSRRCAAGCCRPGSAGSASCSRSPSSSPTRTGSRPSS